MRNMCDSLAGKVALITGASSGLGSVFCQSLAANGCHVVCAARRADRLQSLCDEINSLATADAHGKSGRAAMVEVDMTSDEASILSSVDRAWHLFGKIDILVNNAGMRACGLEAVHVVVQGAPECGVVPNFTALSLGALGKNGLGAVADPLDYEESEWRKVMATNLRGMFFMVKAVGRLMKVAGTGGSIINISSIAGTNRGVLPGGVIYSTSKAAIHRMTEAMALELGKYNIRVNAIAPGLFRSEITNGLYEKEWINKAATKIVPLGRWGSADPDLTSVLLLLASDASSYITGNSFIVDGGQTLPGAYIWSFL